MCVIYNQVVRMGFTDAAFGARIRIVRATVGAIALASIGMSILDALISGAKMNAGIRTALVRSAVRLFCFVPEL